MTRNANKADFTIERLILAAAAVLLAVGFVLGVGTGVVLAHDAMPTPAQPQGWTYPLACCSGIDCREVNNQSSGVEVAERPEGYVISTTGEVVAYDDVRVKDSPDGVFHWCSIAGALDSRTICLFVPPRSF